MGRRGGPVRPAVLAACLAAAASCAAPAAPPPPELARLLADLGDPAFRIREEADRALRAVAAEHYEALERARDRAGDLEVRERLDAVLSCPRIALLHARLRVPSAPFERWFRVEHEEVAVGVRRLAFDGTWALDALEEEIDGDPVLQEVRWRLGPDLAPERLEGRFFPVWGEGLLEVSGDLAGDVWKLSRKGKEGVREARLAWSEREFPLEAALVLLPAWTRAGPPGRELLLRSPAFPDLELKGCMARSEGKDRFTLRHEGEDRPFLTVFLDAEGRIETLQASDNLRAVAVPAEEGKALLERYAKAREDASRR